MDRELYDAMDAVQAAAEALRKAEVAEIAARFAWKAASRRLSTACRSVVPAGQSTVVIRRNGRNVFVDFSDSEDTLFGLITVKE